LFFAFLAVALLILFFFVFLRGSKAPDQVAVEESMTEGANNVLINYLNSPVAVGSAVGSEVVNFADLIRMWYKEKPKYQSLLEKTTTDALPKEAPLFDIGGTIVNLAYWVEIYETDDYQKNSPLYIIRLNMPSKAILQWKRAATTVPVNEYKTITVVVNAAEVS
jgi:hypothetical protein